MEILEDLARRESELISLAEALHGTIEKKIIEVSSLETGKLYRAIFKEYAELCFTNIEALKRGLFLIWYCMAEPEFITGMDYFDVADKGSIINSLENYFTSKFLDPELEWMFSYYCNWSYCFIEFKTFALFQLKVEEYENKIELPRSINREKMNLRGNMGYYWNSLNCFSK